MVRGQEPVVPASSHAQVLLPVHLRVLLQPLGHHRLSRHDALHLLYDDWRGYVIAGFSLVWLANVYMSFFGRLRLEIREERLEIAAAESKEHASRP